MPSFSLACSSATWIWWSQGSSIGVANTAATFSGFAAKALPAKAVSAAAEAIPPKAWRRVSEGCARKISFRFSGFFIWPLLSLGRRRARRSDDVPNVGHHLGESFRAVEIFVHTVKVFHRPK